MFKASPKLVELYIEGLVAELEEVEMEPYSSFDLLIFEYEISRDIDTIINNYAKIKAYDTTSCYVSQDGYFVEAIEGLVFEEIEPHPSICPEFFSELLEQVKLQVHVFSGRWGKLVIDDQQNLVLQLEPRTSRKLSEVICPQ